MSSLSSPYVLLMLLCGGCSLFDAEPPPSSPVIDPNIDPETLEQGEDLRLSWRETLNVAVERIPAETGCEDSDGDGFSNALSCPGASPARLDCDDADPSVTPDTERWVRKGPFLMGSDSVQSDRDEQPIHVVHLTGYCLDRYEVTQEQYASWANRRGRKVFEVEEGKARHPVTGVSWKDAMAYCRSQGKHLPTEAQWEKAARGGCELGLEASRCDPDDLRPYPWGKAQPTCALSNHRFTLGGESRLCNTGTQPVGRLPDGAGPYGHHDLAGNAWEFTQDVYHPGAYTLSVERTDPGGPAFGAPFAIRGGAWDTDSRSIRAAERFPDLVQGIAVGFRCARLEAKAKPSSLPQMKMVPVSGEITLALPEDAPPRTPSPRLEGEALWLSAFAAGDTTDDGRPAAYALPVVRTQLKPNRRREQRFELLVPANQPYRLTVVLETESERYRTHHPQLLRANEPIKDVAIVLQPIEDPSGGADRGPDGAGGSSDGAAPPVDRP